MAKKKDPAAEEEQNDWRSIFHGAGSREEKLGLPEALITSDKNMESKTRLPHVLAMTAMDLMKVWSTGEYQSLEQLLDIRYGTGGFGDRFRINAPNIDGKAREEYVLTSVASILGLNNLQDFNMKRLTEGSKK